jgi:rare lipoprotein A
VIPRHTRRRPARVRALRACIVALVLLLVGATTAAGNGSEGNLGDGPLVDLDPVVDAPIGPGDALVGGGGSILPGQPEGTTEADVTDIDMTGTVAQLELRRAQLVVERNRMQATLLTQEQARRAAERRHDDAVAAIASRLVTLLDAGRAARIRALMDARDEQVPQVRAGLIGALHPQERPLVQELDAAAALVSQLAGRAERTRARALAAGTGVAAIDAVLAQRRGPTDAQLARERGDRFSVDASHVFATGPIPSIGYWGAVSGGGMLTGWMGYAGAAMGGIGCTPPDSSLQPSGAIEMGEASWYGPGFQGNNTASGEVFDTNAMTAAHKTLPFGTIVRVYSSTTARCAFVRINDRGPYIDGRVIDLSRAAADAIGMESIAPVQLEVYAAP